MSDLFNKHFVGVRADGIVILMPPVKPMSKREALVFAAWIVALADEDGDEFDKTLKQVRNL